MRKDVNVMCNLSQGIKEDGIIEGIAIISYNKLITRAVCKCLRNDCRKIKIFY